jgi:hypothetical protein
MTALERIIRIMSEQKTPAPATVRDSLIEVEVKIKEADELLQDLLILKGMIMTYSPFMVALSKVGRELQREREREEEARLRLIEEPQKKYSVCVVDGCEKSPRVYDGNDGYCKPHARDHGIVVHGKI